MISRGPEQRACVISSQQMRVHTHPDSHAFILIQTDAVCTFSPELQALFSVQAHRGDEESPQLPGMLRQRPGGQGCDLAEAAGSEGRLGARSIPCPGLLGPSLSPVRYVHACTHAYINIPYVPRCSAVQAS